MSQDIFRASVAPTQSYEVVAAIRTLLTGSASIVATYWIASADDIYLHVLPEEHAARKRSGSENERPGTCLVVRELMMMGGRMTQIDKIDDVPIQIMAMIHRYPEYVDHHLWLSAIHKRIHDVIVGQTLSLSLSSALLPVRAERLPSVAAYSEDDEAYYSTAQYNVTVKPV